MKTGRSVLDMWPALSQQVRQISGLCPILPLVRASGSPEAASCVTGRQR
jgi:hypothetical protein